LALLPPHPEQVRETVRLFAAQLSAQLPAVDPHPDTALHVTVQHWLLPPTAHVVGVAPHEHVPHVPPPVQYFVQLAG
jgi:hypothetical protein